MDTAERGALNGASNKNSMVHIAIQEEFNNKVAEWLEKYLKKDYYHNINTKSFST